MRKEKKNLLTTDFSTSEDGEKIQLCISSNMVQKTKLCSWELESREKRGAERQEEQEVDGKVIAVSTWSIA